MINALARLELQCVYPTSQGARLTVVDIAGRVKHYDHIVIEMTWVVDWDISGRADAHRSQCSYFWRSYLPRSWPDKLFPWHTRESVNQSRRIKVCYKPNLISVAASIVFNG